VDNSDVFAVGADQADFRCTDTIIDAGSGIALWWRVMRSAGYGFVPLIVEKPVDAQSKRAKRAAQGAKLGKTGVFVEMLPCSIKE
jgi:hypothetical protein